MGCVLAAIPATSYANCTCTYASRSAQSGSPLLNADRACFRRLARYNWPSRTTGDATGASHWLAGGIFATQSPARKKANPLLWNSHLKSASLEACSASAQWEAARVTWYRASPLASHVGMYGHAYSGEKAVRNVSNQRLHIPTLHGSLL
jgi:hypothetical protein